VIGQSLYIKDVPFTVIGVASPEFIGLDQDATDVWIPLQDRPELRPWAARAVSNGLYNTLIGGSS